MSPSKTDRSQFEILGNHRKTPGSKGFKLPIRKVYPVRIVGLDYVEKKNDDKAKETKP